MSIINKIDLDKLKVDSVYKPYVAEALISLDNHFDEMGWDKFLKPAHIENLYKYAFSELGESESSNIGEVDCDEKTLKVKSMKDISTLKHEIMHAMKDQKVVSGVTTQGVKVISNNRDTEEFSKSLEEFTNEMMVGEFKNELYGDGADVVKLLHAVVGDGLIDASLNNNRTQLEDLFYDLTGSDEFLKAFESRLFLMNNKNRPENEACMLPPTILLIELYESIREKELKNTNLTQQEAQKMIEKDKQIRNIINSYSYGNLKEICLNVFNKKMSDLYKSDVIYKLDYKVGLEFEKCAKLIDKKDLSFVDPKYVVSALNGDALREMYETQIKDAITDGEFEQSEQGLRKFIETMKHFQKCVSLTIEENKQSNILMDNGEPLFLLDKDKVEETVFSNKEYKRMFKMISIHLFGSVDEEFINKFSNPNLISDSEIAKQNMGKRIELFSTYIKSGLEV